MQCSSVQVLHLAPAQVPSLPKMTLKLTIQVVQQHLAPAQMSWHTIMIT